MVRLTKIYTRTGDKGTTRLVGGQEVPKEDCRINAYGAIDELNAVLGMCRYSAAKLEVENTQQLQDLDEFFAIVQNNLFNLGSDLATRIEDRWEGMPLVAASDTTFLETHIDQWNANLPNLESFVLPGGSESAAHLHLARTVCRRAEREIVKLSRKEEVGEFVVPYVNRLSDALFVLSRYVIHLESKEEVLWNPRVGVQEGS